jgi:hypothetical protein
MKKAANIALAAWIKAFFYSSVKSRSKITDIPAVVLVATCKTTDWPGSIRIPSPFPRLGLVNKLIY